MPQKKGRFLNLSTLRSKGFENRNNEEVKFAE